jgi:flagellar P-ring protein precursor FlgI
MGDGTINWIEAGMPQCRRWKICCWVVVLLFVMMASAFHGALAQTRIKDVTDVEGVRNNQLIGYGIAAGLNGTGDKLTNAPFTRESLVSMLERLGVNTRDQAKNMDTKNVAAVMVTANMPPFAKPGERIDLTVAALGDATNLTGGTLFVTSLLGADGEVHAVGQGVIATGAIAARGAAQTVTRGVPTSGRIANGATIEKEIPFDLGRLSTPLLGLRNPDLTTAMRIAAAVNRELGGGIAKARDPRTVALNLQGRDVVEALSRIEQLPVEPDNGAKVVIDEASGIIVMGANVVISTVAIAQGNLTIRVTETPQVSQPGAFSNGQTTVVPRTNITVDDAKDKRLGILNKAVTLQELVRNMNALGVGPRDTISILQAIKAAGALQADLEVR